MSESPLREPGSIRDALRPTRWMGVPSTTVPLRVGEAPELLESLASSDAVGLAALLAGRHGWRATSEPHEVGRIVLQNAI